MPIRASHLMCVSPRNSISQPSGAVAPAVPMLLDFDAACSAERRRRRSMQSGRSITVQLQGARGNQRPGPTRSAFCAGRLRPPARTNHLPQARPPQRHLTTTETGKTRCRGYAGASRCNLATLIRRTRSGAGAPDRRFKPGAWAPSRVPARAGCGSPTPRAP